jgi:putative ATP-binding cassette transporter
VAAPQYFAGLIPLGVLTQTADAFAQVQGSLSWFVDTYAQLAQWKAVVDRLTTFSDAMVKAKLQAHESHFKMEPQQAPELVLEDVEVLLPDGRQLLDDVDLTIHQGETVVVRGESGSGKTTLFRVLAGLWPFGSGRLKLPAKARVLFLPQKPYLPVGSLKEALSYPDPPDAYTDRQYQDALESCQLSHLVPRLADPANWALVLSGGEQQRVAFARALLYRPDWLFLDEASSALDEGMERRMYELMRRRLPGAAIISVAHRPAVLAFHDRQITIDPSSHRLATGDAAAS